MSNRKVVIVGSGPRGMSVALAASLMAMGCGVTSVTREESDHLFEIKGLDHDDKHLKCVINQVDHGKASKKSKRKKDWHRRR